MAGRGAVKWRALLAGDRCERQNEAEDVAPEMTKPPIVPILAGSAAGILAGGLIRLGQDAGVWGRHAHRLSAVGTLFFILGAAWLAVAFAFAIEGGRNSDES